MFEKYTLEPKEVVNSSLVAIKDEFHSMNLFSIEVIEDLMRIVNEQLEDVSVMSSPMGYITEDGLISLKHDYMALKFNAKYLNFDFEKVADFMTNYNVDCKYWSDPQMIEKIWVENFKVIQKD